MWELRDAQRTCGSYLKRRSSSNARMTSKKLGAVLTYDSSTRRMNQRNNDALEADVILNLSLGLGPQTPAYRCVAFRMP